MKTVKFTIRSLFTLTLTWLMLSSTVSLAQGKITFAKTEHDFGDFLEGKVAEYSFEFTNTGNAPVALSNVQASCGCTTPEWTRDPVAPGKKGVIKAAYNSQGRPGNFYKTITVSTDTETLTLTIKGNVITNDKVQSSLSYTTYSQMALEKNVHNFGKIQVGEKVSKIFTFTNTGNADLVILGVNSGCGCVTFKAPTTPVKPGLSAAIEIIYEPTQVSNGAREELVAIQTNSITQSAVTLKLVGEIVGSLSKQSILKEKTGGF